MRILSFFFVMIINQFVWSQDSLKIFIVGENFKSETFRFIYQETILEKKTESGINLFSFKIPLASSIADGDLIDIQIYSKKRFSYRFRNTLTVIRYNPNRKYCVLHYHFRLKRRYAFESLWLNEPLLWGRVDFWQDQILDKYKMRPI